jgi:hypothetical protein
MSSSLVCIGKAAYFDRQPYFNPLDCQKEYVAPTGLGNLLECYYYKYAAPTALEFQARVHLTRRQNLASAP